MFTHRKLSKKAFPTGAKVGFNGRVSSLRDIHGVAKADIKPLILWAFMNTDNPNDYAKIEKVFAEHKRYLKWKLDFHYEIKQYGLFQTIRKTRTTSILPQEDESIIKEIEEAFSL
jgi:hypothetical protein